MQILILAFMVLEEKILYSIHFKKNNVYLTTYSIIEKNVHSFLKLYLIFVVLMMQSLLLAFSKKREDNLT